MINILKAREGYRRGRITKNELSIIEAQENGMLAYDLGVETIGTLWGAYWFGQAEQFWAIARFWQEVSDKEMRDNPPPEVDWEQLNN